MAQDTIDKIINIQFNYGELVQGWQKATREIEINKKNLAELKQEYKNGEMSASEYNRALLEITSTTKALNAEKKAYEKEIQNNIKIESQETGSLNQLRASLQKMTAQYNAMSAARREGQEGRLLAASIKSQQEAINEAEMALGNYRSQVGNYENAIKNALPFGNSFLLQLSDSAKQAGSATNMIKGAASAIGSLVKQAAAFIATPLGATIAAIYASYKWLSFQIEEVNDRIKENERLTYKQRESLTAAEAWNAAYTQTIDAMGESAIRTTSRLKTLWTQAKIYTKDFFKFGPMATLVFKAQTNAAEELKGVYDQIAAKEKELTLARRDSYEKLAELETKIAENRLKSNDRQAYSDEQRRQFALDAINATKEQYAIIKDIANKELELEELRASTTENSIETNDKLAQMRAGIIRLEAQEANSLRELQERLNETSDKIKKVTALENFQAKMRDENLNKYSKAISNWRVALGKEVAKIESDIDKAMEESDKSIVDSFKKQVQNEELKFKNRINEARIAGGDLGAAREMIEIYKEQLAQIDKLEDAYRAAGYTDEQIQAERIKARIGVQQAEQNIADIQLRTTQQALGAASQVAGGFSAMFDALGGEGERYAEFSKALAIFEVALQQAQAIAGAVANAAKYSIPWLLPVQIASSIAAVVAAIAQATQATDSAQTPKYASGGLVTGPGTGTSDSIPAMLSNGEAVMTAQAVNDWGAMLSAMNVASGGNAIQVSNLPQRNDGMKGMERMMERALMNMPAPIVSVVDINKGQKRVKVQNSLGKLGRKKYE